METTPLRIEKEPPVPKIIAFDVGGVVMDFSYDILFRVLQNYGVPEERIKNYEENPDYFEFCRGNIDGSTFHRALVNKHLKSDLTLDQVVDALNKELYGINCEVVAILEELASLPSSKIVFITDTNPWQTERKRSLIDLGKFSDTIIRSHEVGVLKTDKNFFSKIQSHLDVRPEEILLIDDNPEIIEKAEANGWQVYLFRTAPQLVDFLRERNILE